MIFQSLETIFFHQYLYKGYEFSFWSRADYQLSYKQKLVQYKTLAVRKIYEEDFKMYLIVTFQFLKI